MDTDKLSEYARLTARKRELDAELRAVKEEMEPLEQAILADFAEAGVQATKIDGPERPVNISINRKILARGLQGQDGIVTACKAAGFGDMVQERVNGNSLNALVAEIVKGGDELPPEFEGFIEPLEKFALSVRSA